MSLLSLRGRGRGRYVLYFDYHWTVARGSIDALDQTVGGESFQYVCLILSEMHFGVGAQSAAWQVGVLRLGRHWNEALRLCSDNRLDATTWMTALSRAAGALAPPEELGEQVLHEQTQVSATSRSERQLDGRLNTVDFRRMCVEGIL